MDRKYRSLKKIALATLALGALAQPAAAGELGDFKIYPGSMCVARGVQGNPNLKVEFNGAILNLSTTSELNVMCPIVRDNLELSSHLPPGDANPTKVRVNFIDQNPDTTILGSVRCTLFSRNSDGATVASSLGRSDVSSQNDGGSTFRINPLHYQDDPLFLLRGYMHMECIIPKAVVDSTGLKSLSGIRMYEVRENLHFTPFPEISFTDEEL
jgi:hypothetical protein